MQALYAACIGQGMDPAGFWAMPPGEVWWFLEAKNPKMFISKTEEAELDYLISLLDEDVPD